MRDTQEMTLKKEIGDCLDILYNSNQMIHDYWGWTLFDDNDNLILDEWNEKNLKLIQKDVEASTFCNEWTIKCKKPK